VKIAKPTVEISDKAPESGKIPLDERKLQQVLDGEIDSMALRSASTPVITTR
jgi:hypothetical protein